MVWRLSASGLVLLGCRVKCALEERLDVLGRGVERDGELLERASRCQLEDAVKGHGRLLVAGLDLVDALAEGLHDAHGVLAAAAANLVLEVLLLEGAAVL